MITAGISQTGNDLLLSWVGGGALYQVQITTNLSSPDWQNLGTPVNTNRIVITPTNAAAFYRIIGQ